MRSRFDIPRVTAVRHVRDHVLWIAFDDGVSGTVDLSARLVGPALEALRDSAVFAEVRLGAETIEWPNGADWSPESLYDDVTAANGTIARGNDAGGTRDSSYSPAMPEVSQFYGIVIMMFYDEHIHLARPAQSRRTICLSCSRLATYNFFSDRVDFDRSRSTCW
jgi:hypothetical protein